MNSILTRSREGAKECTMMFLLRGFAASREAKILWWLGFSAGLMLVLAACGGKPEEVVTRATPVEVVVVAAAGSYPVREEFVGVVEARRRANLAFEVAGTVTTVGADEGDAVDVGEELAGIDVARLEAQRAELTAAIAAARATLKRASSDFDRNRKLRETRVIEAQQMDQAEEGFRAAQANVRRTEARLESVEVDLGKSVLRAPFAGTVARRMIDEGAVVSPNQPVFELLESEVLEVRAALVGEALDGLEIGDAATVVAGGGEREFPVARILPQRDPRTRTVDVILSVPTGSGLRDGDLVGVRREREVAAEGFFLPQDSLTESARGLWACFVVVPDGESGELALDRRDVEVLHEYGDVVYARGAIGAGDRVVGSGLQKVAPGQRVKVVKTEPMGGAPAGL